MSSQKNTQMNTSGTINVLQPDWPAPPQVRAISTTRSGGVSEGCYAGLNLALHVEDDPQHVAQNRQQLMSCINQEQSPVWLEQVHGQRVVDLSLVAQGEVPQADASMSQSAKTGICTVMTADCLPILICNRQGTRVAAAHAGWRGLAEGVIESTIKALQQPADQLLVWLGPAIGPEAFEVGDDVREVFLRQHYQTEAAFVKHRPGHYMADIYQLARIRLSLMGIESVYGGGYCTFSDADQFFSFRRDGKTGRQASMIWLTKE